MTGGYDERCAADLAAVCDGRDLSREDRAWLARVVTGAVRPNRDKPLWDLAHALAALAQATAARNGRDLVTLALDPGLATGTAVSARFSETIPADARGPVFGEAWRTSWAGLARLLALAEFVLTAEDLAQFSAVTGWIDDLAAASDAEGAAFLAKRLARHLAAYRNAHLPLAPLERRFRAILGFLEGRKDFGDDDILAFWRTEMEAGERPGFRTIAEHFVTFEAGAHLVGGLDGLSAPVSLDAHAGWEERLDAALGDLAAAEPAETLAALLADWPEGPKILTGAEREDLADFLRLEPFHRTRPLTTLRAASFGRVQSGIANRLRRGGGGAEVAERASCAEAESYAALQERAGALAAHLARMLRIAAALRIAERDGLTPEVRAALEAAEADLRRVRRAGFEDRAALTAGFAAAQAALLRLTEEADRLERALAALARQRSLDVAFAADRSVFAAAFAAAYAGEAAA
ncbi:MULTISPECIES: hypothetical protein [Methylorubrum]|uniref:hypothetical protein n=1 Tax=Methylorubrum TaxID=2282523 RepID=UPI0020A0C522|nr:MULTISPECIES: hypothetical protein [Methylorubrum]MCP1546762.1 hypothetical protein [Methylorubrum zatmanii]MCP1551959.1 hypothetical protein [Methylorubrum extorquens]MCP1577065.1 hypothetical protein [Methylorubrum extorquens]